jgi:hypothetical protein
MALKNPPGLEITEDLLEAIRSFPVQRGVEHCGVHFSIAPFDFYAKCPQCGTRIKVRAFSGGGELEDIFDAVFEWMNQPKGQEVAKHRQADIESES